MFCCVIGVIVCPTSSIISAAFISRSKASSIDAIVSGTPRSAQMVCAAMRVSSEEKRDGW